MEEKSNRIQTSILNGVERKVLVYLAERMPSWVSSDLLTFVGFLGSLIIAAGYMLSGKNINWLWLSSFGFIVNWWGDSLDGTLARVRNARRPIYGFYLDHTVDMVNEVIMFTGIGLSPLMRLPIALMALTVYLLLTVNVCVNAHLKGEFKLTYAGFGPTELRLLLIIINTLFIFVGPLREFSLKVCGRLSLSALDCIGLVIVAALWFVFIVTAFKDAREYARIDPPKDASADR